MAETDYLSSVEKLPLRELLAYWINLEGDKAELYDRLSSRVRELNADIAFYDMFKLLSQEARRHEKKLRDLYAKKFDGGLPEIDGPSLEELTGAIELESRGDIMDTLRCALQLEELAERVYSILAEKADDEYMRAVFSYLGSTERLHQRAMESMIQDNNYHGKMKDGVEA